MKSSKPPTEIIPGVPLRREMRRLDSLTIHPLAARLPMVPTEHLAEMQRHIYDTHMLGEVLAINEEGEIIDGRHRHSFGLSIGIEEAECDVFAESDAEALILSRGLGRNHLDKGARAYWYWPMFAPRAKGKGGIRRSNPNHSGLIESGALTFAEIGKIIGVSEDLIGWAKEAHEIFEANPDLRELHELAIIRGDTPLNRLKSAIGGKKMKNREDTVYLALDEESGALAGVLPKSLASFRNGFAQWDEIPQDAKLAFRAQWRELIEILPADLRVWRAGK